MSDIKLLKRVIKDSGMSKTVIAQRSGIERTTMYNRLRGMGEFSMKEAYGLQKALRMSDDLRDRIFLN